MFTTTLIYFYLVARSLAYSRALRWCCLEQDVTLSEEWQMIQFQKRLDANTEGINKVGYLLLILAR